jgi:SAM-dependent methyltransferase
VADSCPACAAPLGLRPVVVSRDRVHGTVAHVEVARCQTCGTGVTLPRVGPDDLAGFYPSDYAPYDEPPPGPLRWISAAIRARQARRAWRRGPLAPVRGHRPGRALDVGCGRGDLAAALAGAGWRADGIEPSPAACAHARARGVDARTGTLATLDLEAEAYDFVLFHHSLEHTDDPERDLRAVARALRPGGTLVIVVPNFGGWQARRFKGCWYHLDVPRHRTHFTAGGLRALLHRTGLAARVITTPSTTVGLPASVQYRIWGRCLFPSGLGLRVAVGLCVWAAPVVGMLDATLGEGDLIHIEAALESS